VARATKIALILAGAAAIAVASGGAALAAGHVFSSDDESQAIIEDAAKQLDVQPGELEDALKQALENRIDEAVDEGRLTEEQAQRLKERLDSAQTPLLFGGPGFGRFGFGHGPWHGHFGSFATLDAAASYLGLTEVELRAKLADGKSLADVAAEEGKSVEGLVQALVRASTERIDEAVKNGKLTDAQADALKENLEERIRDRVNREPGSFGPFGKSHRFGQGFFGQGFFGQGFAPRSWRGERPAPFAGPRA
jgi:polyhydroxyalkanoate synthesis regulator phasin